MGKEELWQKGNYGKRETARKGGTMIGENCDKRREGIKGGGGRRGRGAASKEKTAGKEIIGGEKTVGTGRRAAAGYSKPGILPGKTGM